MKTEATIEQGLVNAYYLLNSDNKLELHLDGKNAYQSLSEETKTNIKRAFIWGRQRGAWVSRSKYGGVPYSMRGYQIEFRGEQEQKTFEEAREQKIARAEYFRQYNQSEAGKESKREYYEKNKELVKIKALARPNEIRREYRKKHKKNNPDIYRVLVNERRRRFRNATPKWLTKEDKRAIRQLYIDAMTVTRITGVPYVVDHDYPLNGETICGLHVPTNLKIMTREENLKKSNKLVDTPNPPAYTETSGKICLPDSPD